MSLISTAFHKRLLENYIKFWALQYHKDAEKAKGSSEASDKNGEGLGNVIE